MGQMATGNPQLMTSEAFCVLNAWTIDVMAMAIWQLFFTGHRVCLHWNPGCHYNRHRDVQNTFDAASANILITLKPYLHGQWHFKSFSYRTVIKSHQIISVTLSRGTNWRKCHAQERKPIMTIPARLRICNVFRELFWVIYNEWLGLFRR